MSSYIELNRGSAKIRAPAYARAIEAFMLSP